MPAGQIKAANDYHLQTYFRRFACIAMLAASLLFGAPARAQEAPPTGPAPVRGDTGASPAARAANEASPPNSNQAQGQAPPDFSDTLTGDWGGLRTRLANDGLTVTGVYHADGWRSFSGGLKTGDAFDDDFDLQLSGDGEKLYGLPGSSFFIYGLNNDGGRVNQNLVGSAGGIDNLEVAKPRPKLFEAWLQQNFFDDRLSFLGGLYDTDTEFEVTDSSVLFLNPAFGTSTEFGAAGIAGPAAFPESSAGGRILVRPLTDTYIQVALVGGHPRDPGDPDGLRFGYGPHAGVLALGEAGYRNDDKGHYAIGGYHFTRGLDDFDGTSDGRGRQGDSGYYGLAERKLWSDAGDKDRSLSGFVRLGFAEQSVSPFAWSWSAGVSAAKPITSRPDSQAGLAIAQTRTGDDFRRFGGPDIGDVETQFEVTYADKPLPWLTLQPDLQYTLHPALDTGHDNALTGGVRLIVNF